MNVRTERRITQGEYLRELEARHGAFRIFEKTARADPELRPLLEQWKHLLAHPERDQEPITLSKELVFHDVQRFLETISPQRLRLLDFLRTHPHVGSLQELARRLGRDYRNVHDDARRLAAAGVLRLEAGPRRVIPRVVADSIQVTI